MSVVIVRALLAAAMACGAPTPIAGAGVDLHWSPSEDLDHIYLGLTASSRRTTDMAAFGLTDYAVVSALHERPSAGLRVHPLLDGGELEGLLRRNPGHPAGLAARHPNIEIKVKPPAARMHLKACAGDGAVLRFGSAGFSPSGLKPQDYESAIVRDRDTTQRFEKTFEALWSRSDNTSLEGK